MDREKLRHYVATLRFHFLREAPEATPEEIEHYLLDNGPHPTTPGYRIWAGEVAIQTLENSEKSTT